MEIFFWSEQKFSKFSNFSKTPMVIDGKQWDTVEHFFQAMKTEDEQQQERIRKTSNPKEAKKLGRKVTLRQDWEQVRYLIMLKALRVKFSTEPLKSLLLDTKDAVIYEDSPYDMVWGTGVRGGVGKGRNLLGKAIMQVRDEMLALIPPTLF